MKNIVNCPHCGTEVQVSATVEETGTEYHVAGTRKEAKHATAYPVGEPPFKIATSCDNGHRFFTLYTATGSPVIE